MLIEKMKIGIKNYSVTEVITAAGSLLIILLLTSLQLKFSSLDHTVLFSWNSISRYFTIKNLILLLPIFFISVLLLNKINWSKSSWIILCASLISSIFFWNIPQINPDAGKFFGYVVKLLDKNLLYMLKTDFLSYETQQPLLPILWGLSMKIFSENLLVINIIQTFFYLIIIYYIILLGTEIRDLNTGIIASILFLSISNILAQSGLMLTDIPLTTFVLITNYYYLKSFHYRKIKYFILTLLFAVITVFTKITGIFFLVPLVLILFLNKRTNSKKKIKYIFFLILILIPTFIMFYFVNKLYDISTFFTTFFNFSNKSVEYLLVFIFQINPIIILLALNYFLSRKNKKREHYVYFLCTICIPLVFIFIFAHKVALFRYSFPIMPFICVTGADSMVKIFKKRAYIFALSIILVSIYITLSGYYSFCMKSSAVNLKKASYYMKDFKTSNIGVVLNYQNAYNNPEVLIPIYDLYSKHNIFLEDKNVSYRKGHFNWTKKFILPQRYKKKKNDPDFLLVISNNSQKSNFQILNKKKILFLKKFTADGNSIINERSVLLYKITE